MSDVMCVKYQVLYEFLESCKDMDAVAVRMLSFKDYMAEQC